MTRCPMCAGRTRVLNTRPGSGRTIRTRSCLDPHCRHRFRTIELHEADAASARGPADPNPEPEGRRAPPA